MSADMNKDLGNDKLAQIQRGMKVYDRADKYLGKVEQVYLGGESAKTEEQGKGPAETSSPDLAPPSNLMTDIARGAAPEGKMPDEFRNRLLREGFIRVDAAGLVGSDRYILPEQIASVSGDHVQLAAARNELIKS